MTEFKIDIESVDQMKHESEFKIMMMGYFWEKSHYRATMHTHDEMRRMVESSDVLSDEIFLIFCTMLEEMYKERDRWAAHEILGALESKCRALAKEERVFAALNQDEEVQSR